VAVVSTIASMLLVAAFLVAGGSKIAAGPSWPVQARELGAPAVAIPLLPWVEIAVGAVLVGQLAPVAAGVLALVLLVAFTTLIVRRLAEGRHPPCACFGAWSASPLGWRHVARNAVLIVLAGLTVVG
jgi:uncharacterized membrane protein YphA (DoxX/SURF4 family)